MINVLGDALAAGIMAHICKKDFERAATAAAAANTPTSNGGGYQRVRRIFSLFKLGQVKYTCTCEDLNTWKLDLKSFPEDLISS